MTRNVTCLLFAAILVTSCFGQQGSTPAAGQEGVISTALPSVSAAPQKTGGSQYQSLMELPAVIATDVLVYHTGYVSSYNTKTLIPNWVAYELLPSEMTGEADRDEHIFSMDMDLKQPQAMREDYRDSGWTKGHLAPAADFSWSDEAMDGTFRFVNCCPQDETLNSKDWQYLERQVRRWAEDYGRVWVVSGPIIGENKYGTIGDRKVVVPDEFFKAVMVRVKGKYHSIAFVMGNDAKRYFLSDCALTVNELEDITGMDFFPNLDDTVEERVENELQFPIWNIRKR